ncbi:MAG: AMP-dependent synthetase/ligase [Myxococcota bacterium]|nr:AMP-dependent synthetase/ligase [Myxococcota bacterium]
MARAKVRQRLLPAMLSETMRRYRHRVCSYHQGRQASQWKALTWADWEQEVSAAVCALQDLDIRSGDRIGILSATRREWLSTDISILCTGAITVGIYATHTAEQCEYILKHAGVRLLFLEDRDQLFKIRSVWSELPDLEQVILFEPAPELEDDSILSYSDFISRGKALDSEEDVMVWERCQDIDPESIAAIAYTSGTTGHPKGVMLTHQGVASTLYAIQRAVPMQDSDVSIVNLSLAHSLQRIGAWSGLVCGSTLVFGDRLDRFPQHMKQFRPTVQLSVPRVFEKLYGAIMEEVSEQDIRRRKMFEWALDVARQVKESERAGKNAPRHMRLQLAAAERTVLVPLRERFGGRIRFFVCGAAPLSSEIVEFFDACGMPILEGYGLTETCAPATVNTLRASKYGTVGRPLDMCEIKIASDGEVLIRGENVMSGYYRDSKATKEAIDRDGWLQTGDLGALDEDGYLTITGRKKDIIITAGGKNISPANIEGAFEREALIQHAVVFGDRQKFLVGLFDLEPDVLAQYIERFNLGELSPAEQRTHPQVVAEVQLIVDRVNRTLARFETVKYFAVTQRPLSISEDTLTPTLKVRRAQVREQFSAVIEALFLTRRNTQTSLW